MPELPDLVKDSQLLTKFCDSVITHLYDEIDERGGRFLRQEHWRWGRPLGHGGYGTVLLQTCTAKSAKPGSLRAVKILRLNSSKDLVFNRELEAIAKFSNERYRRWFVKSFGWFKDKDHIYITMEYCRYGDFHRYLTEVRLVPTVEVQQLAHQITEGLCKMHLNNFAHRDLKLSNILIKSRPPEGKWWVVLADFGISKRTEENSGPTTAIRGTPGFMAPELLLEDSDLNYKRPKSIADFQAADMWALGEVVFRMLTGEATFQADYQLKKYFRGQQEFPSDRLITATDGGRDFIASVMQASPQCRMTATASIEHPWINSLRIEEELVALSIEKSNQPEPELPQRDSASARWTTLSDEPTTRFPARRSTPYSMVFDRGPTHEIARRRPKSPPHSEDADATKTRLQPAPGDLSTNTYQNTDRALVNFTDARLVKALESHTRRITYMNFSPDGKRLASGSLDKTIQFWSAETGVQLLVPTGYESPVHVDHVYFSPDSKWMVIGSLDHKDNTLWLWSVESGSLMQILEHEFLHWFVTFSPDGKRLVTTSSLNSKIKLWSVGSWAHVQKLEVHQKGIAQIAFSPDSRWLVAVVGKPYNKEKPQNVMLWSAESGVFLRTIGPGGGYSCDHIGPVAFSRDSERLAYTMYTDTPSKLKLWSLESGTLIQTFQSYVRKLYHIEVFPDGERLATFEDQVILRVSSPTKTWRVRIWCIKSGTPIKTLERPSWSNTYYLQQREFSPDYKRLITLVDGENAAMAWLWSIESGKIIQTLRSITLYGNKKKVVFSPDSKWLASAQSDNTVRLWSAESGILVQTLRGHSDKVSGLAFSPDGKRLASVGIRDSVIRLWSIGSGNR